MKRTFLSFTALLVVLALQAFAQEMTKEVTVEGWVSDTKCAAHGIKNCDNKEHLKQGAKLALVADSDHKVWVIENPEKLADHQGHHVQVKGTAKADTGTISVQQVSMTKEKMKEKM
jgi:hypothetical protein